ncbi:zinc finger CCCH domain-containing protein 19-like [Pistacia vera]|uniref:zinc finger CCCH domain-containing protein 19-like n=1 Tax=Pistacia vera TaxID=55513 RepID=UPI00126389DB|nr:zinc finger CCCH domain-containing protein 19-like [Pistacia vera]
MGVSLVARPEILLHLQNLGVDLKHGEMLHLKARAKYPVHLPAQSPAFAQPHASSFILEIHRGFSCSRPIRYAPSDSWRPLLPGQSNIQPLPAQPTHTLGYGCHRPSKYCARQGPENQYWLGQMPVTQAWLGRTITCEYKYELGNPEQAQAPGNANSGWSAPVNGQFPGNAIPSWVPPGQGPPPLNANPGWVAPGQGQPLKCKSRLGGPYWEFRHVGGEQKNGGDRFSGQRMDSSGGDPEILRLSHLRDRASDLGRRKELRECVEKLQLLKTPEERQRRLEDIPEIHSDPNMDPSYESDEDEGETDDKRQENSMRPRGSGFSRRGREPISPGRVASASNDSFSGTRNYSGGNKELSRNLSNKGFSNKGDDLFGAGEIVNENLWNQARAKETQQLNSWEKPRIASNLETRNPHSVVLSEPSSRVVSEISPIPGSTGGAQSSPKINESEKMWHYKDPSGKVQGPFSMVQLRKWNNTGYFPTNLGIWRSNEKPEDSILLTDALSGKFNKDPPLMDSSLSQTVSYSGKPHGATLQQGMEIQVGGNSNFDQNRTAWNSHDSLSSVAQSVLGSSTGGAASSSLEVPKSYRDGWGSETNLPSPTPSTTVQTKGKTFEREWSPTPTKPSGPLMMANQFSGGNGGQQSSTLLVPESGQLLHTSIPTPSTSKLSGNVDSLNMSHGVSLASKPEIGESHRVLVNSHQLPVTNSTVASMNAGVDLKNIGAAIQNLVQPVTTQIPPVETHGWGSGLVARPEMIAPSPKPGSGSQAWGNASSQKLEPNNPVHLPAQSPAFAQPHASSFSTGNPSGVFPAPGQSGMPPSDSWRPLLPGQSNIQPLPAQPNIPWGMGVTGHQSTVPRQGPENQGTGWGQMPVNPSMGWGGQLPASTNMNWGTQGQAQAPGNANSGWSAPVNGQVPGNAIPSWVPPGQGPPPLNANPGWVAPGQGPAPGNANPGWGAPTGNSGMWGGEQKNGGDRFSGQRDRTPQGGDPGYGGGRPWNRQSSFGNRGGVDSSRPPFNKGQRVCKFHESGHCKKGSQCDYLHT